MLGIYGFKTKKDLKQAIGRPVQFIETSIFGLEYKGDGQYAVVGPSPNIRKWYATVTVKNNLITGVK